MFDVIIVGGGAAGLSSGLLLGRCRRRVLICDSGQYRNTDAREIHGFLTRDGITPGDFLQAARCDLQKYDTVAYKNMEVRDAEPSAEGFRVLFPDGSTETCRKLLLATGIVDDLPDLPNTGYYYGKSVHHCPYCDGWEWRDKPVAVYGRGEKGNSLALELTAWTRDLTLCTNGPSLLSAEHRERLARNQIRVCEDYIVDLEGADGQLNALVLANNERLQIRALSFNTGERQRSYLPAKLGCEFDEHGTVKTGDYETTTVPGLYVAGDASRGVQSLIVAASEGAQAAFAINIALLKQDLL